MKLIPRFFKTPKGSFVLLGPRGSGKTTWLRDRFPGATHLDIASPALRHSLANRPQRLRELLADAPGTQTVVIDEVQHMPRLLGQLQGVLSEPSPPRFILSASCSRAFVRGAGRSAVSGLARHTFHPLMASEMRDFDLDRALRFGMLAEAATASNPEQVLDRYAKACIAEVMARGLTRHIGRFRRFLRAVCTTHGSPLNIAAVARRCAVERKIVAGYILILENLMLSFRVPVYRKQTMASRASGLSAGRATVSRDKLFLFDSGVFRTLDTRRAPESPDEVGRKALAGLVAQHLMAWSAGSPSGPKLSYWRTRAGTEVDLVVEGSHRTLAFGIKDGATVGARDLTPLRAFLDDHPDSETALLYRGTRVTRIDGIWHLPVDTFLRHMRPGQELLDWVKTT